MHQAVLIGVTLVVSVGLIGCQSQGPGRVPPDRFDYNQAIFESANEQMLLNLVRLRYNEVPTFLAVDSVLTQYVYTGSVGVEGGVGTSGGEPLRTLGGSGSYRFAERPTITYSPLRGDEFAAQLLDSISVERVFSLVESGWPPEELLYMTMYRINEAVNAEFGAFEEEDVARLRRFKEKIEALVDLAQLGSVDIAIEDEADGAERFLEFREGPDPESRAKIDAFKRMVDLRSDLDSFRVVVDRRHREEDEVVIRVRSLLELMGFLAQGVTVPREHAEAGYATWIDADDLAARKLLPMVVRAERERPEGVFVAVEFEGFWYFIPRSDARSKQAFGLLTYLMELQSPRAPAAAPIITVPAG